MDGDGGGGGGERRTDLNFFLCFRVDVEEREPLLDYSTSCSLSSLASGVITGSLVNGFE